MVAGYIKDVWFDKNSITNIFDLYNLIQQYRVTYDRLYEIFTVHREEKNKPNIPFRMHDSGLHYYNPAEYFTLVTTFAENEKNYSKQQIKSAEMAAELYGTVTYPSVPDYRWAIQSNQIK